MAEELVLVIPINHNRMHWSFIVLAEKIKIFDSLKGSYPNPIFSQFYENVMKRNI